MDEHDGSKHPTRHQSVLHYRVLTTIFVVFVVLAMIQAAALPGPGLPPSTSDGLEACEHPTPDGYYACLNESGDVIEYYNGCRYDRSTTTHPEYLGCSL